MDIMRNTNMHMGILYGNYKQKDDGSQTKQPIEWIILRYMGGKTCLLSRYCLDCYQFHFKDIDIDWAHCDLRAWLKEIFLPQAFSYEEQRHMCHIPVDTLHSLKHLSTKAEEEKSFDLVSVMEKSEALSYFKTFYARQCSTTDYAESILRSRGILHPTRVCSWWLRDGQAKRWKAPAMGRIGMVNYYPVTDIITLVRPMICVNDEGLKNRTITTIESERNGAPSCLGIPWEEF